MVNVDVSPGNINPRARFLRRGLIFDGRFPASTVDDFWSKIFRAGKPAQNAGIFDVHCSPARDENFMLKR
jgi:hypothetical protein